MSDEDSVDVVLGEELPVLSDALNTTHLLLLKEGMVEARYDYDDVESD